MTEREVVIINRLGLHARAAAKFVNLASRFQSEVHLEKAGRRVNGKSIMGIMMLAAGKGTAIKITTSGEDEHEAMEKLIDLVQSRFEEEE